MYVVTICGDDVGQVLNEKQWLEMRALLKLEPFKGLWQSQKYPRIVVALETI